MTTETHSEQRILSLVRFVAGYWEEHGYAPTIREIVHELDLSSTSIAAYWVRATVQAGLVKVDALHARTIRLTEAGRAMLQ